MTEQESEEYQRKFLKLREKMLKEQAEMPEEERRRNREMNEMINAYEKNIPKVSLSRCHFLMRTLKRRSKRISLSTSRKILRGIMKNFPKDAFCKEI